MKEGEKPFDKKRFERHDSLERAVINKHIDEIDELAGHVDSAAESLKRAAEYDAAGKAPDDQTERKERSIDERGE